VRGKLLLVRRVHLELDSNVDRERHHSGEPLLLSCELRKFRLIAGNAQKLAKTHRTVATAHGLSMPAHPGMPSGLAAPQ